MVQTASPSRRQRVEQAIEHALARRWDAAAEENRTLLDEHPDDTESANRLGKALTELEDYAGAVKAYEHTVAIDPTNPIARKNLARLSDRRDDGAPAPTAKAKASKPSKPSRPSTRKTGDAGELRANSLIEESGKSAEFELIDVNAQALKRLTAGDAAALAATDGGVAVTTPRGAELGTIERRAALRLKRMIEGGNGYAVVIRHIEDGKASVYIRETHTDPSLASQASFIAPAKRKAKARAYTRSSVVQHDPEQAVDPDDDDNDAQDGAGATDSADATQAGEMEERGFTAAAANEEDDDASDEPAESDDADEDEELEPEDEDDEDPD